MKKKKIYFKIDKNKKAKKQQECQVCTIRGFLV